MNRQQSLINHSEKLNDTFDTFDAMNLDEAGGDEAGGDEAGGGGDGGAWEAERQEQGGGGDDDSDDGSVWFDTDDDSGDESDDDMRLMRLKARRALNVLLDPERAVQVAFGRAAAIGDMQLAATALGLGAHVDRHIFNPVNWNAPDYTAIYVAAYRGFHLFVEFLLRDYGANVNLGHGTWTPLHGACFMGNTQCVTILLAHGADPNRINRHGETPLFLAVYEGSIESLRALAEGARVPLNVNAVTTGGGNAGMTALDYALTTNSRNNVWGRAQCVTFLRNELGALRAQDIKQPKRPKNARKKG